MKEEHHALTLGVASDLIRWWRRHPGTAPLFLDLDRIEALLRGEPGRVKKMLGWVKEADHLDDIELEQNLVSKLIHHLGNPTSFQHFAYCGSMGDLRDGAKVVRKYDGYCFDCDPFLPRISEITQLSRTAIRFNSDCAALGPGGYKDSPLQKKFTNQYWDNQVYPSVIDLAEHYGNCARENLRQPSVLSDDFNIKRLSFAIHMLQDTCVPHHVLSTILHGHADYEESVWSYWLQFYADRPKQSSRDAAMEYLLSPATSQMLDGFRDLSGFGDIGKKSVDLTRQRLERHSAANPSTSRQEAIGITVQAVACTICALNLV